MHSVLNFIGFAISPLSVLVPLFFYFRKIRVKKERHINILAILLVVSGVADLIGYLLWRKKIPNAFVLNSFFTIQFFLLSYLYYQLLNKKIRIYLPTILYVAFLIINTIYIQPFNEYQSWMRMAGSLILILYAILFFRQLLLTLPTDKLATYPPFWISTAVFYYFSFNLFLFIVSNYAFTHLTVRESMLFWSFHNVNNVVKNLLFATGIYYAGRATSKAL